MPNKTRNEKKSNIIVPQDGLSRVHYAKDPLLRGRLWEFPDEYDEIASIREVDLEEIFRVFNTLDGYMDPRVIDLAKTVRSMSIGDVVVKPDGSTWRCIDWGWKPIHLHQRVSQSA